MKKILAIAILIALIVMPSVSAQVVGLGLKWNIESKIVDEGETACIEYGLYNPFDEDVMGFLRATKELEPLVASADDPQLVAAGTSSTETLPAQICFEIPSEVYSKNCILGIACERACPDDMVLYSGEVEAAYTIPEGETGQVGSQTGSSTAVPLQLAVKCKPQEMSYMPLIALAIAAIIVVGGFAFYKLRK